jgi:hypothetical protein
MPRTRRTVCVPGNTEILNRILEGGRVLASLIGKDFPVADDVWLGINQFNRMICESNIEDTWVTMITADNRMVSVICIGVLLFVPLSLMPYFR